MKPARIIIFAKAPRPGFAKTRLIPVLGMQGAARLARRMLLQTVRSALKAQIGRVELCVTPAIVDEAWRGIDLPQEIEISDQGDGDLGARLARAARRRIEQGEQVILIGTDCLELTPQLLEEARQRLFDHDATIHCTADGGYALLGLDCFNAALFGNIPWSTDAVAVSTLQQFARLGMSVYVGQMLHDVDEPRDLRWLPENWRSFVPV